MTIWHVLEIFFWGTVVATVVFSPVLVRAIVVQRKYRAKMQAISPFQEAAEDFTINRSVKKIESDDLYPDIVNAVMLRLKNKVDEDNHSGTLRQNEMREIVDDIEVHLIAELIAKGLESLDLEVKDLDKIRRAIPLARAGRFGSALERVCCSPRRRDDREFGAYWVACGTCARCEQCLPFLRRVLNSAAGSSSPDTNRQKQATKQE